MQEAHCVLVGRELIMYQFTGTILCTNEQGADYVLVSREYTLYQCKHGAHCVLMCIEHTAY